MATQLLARSVRFHSKAYSLLEKIGQGGFGEVHKAKQLTTGQLVAIKFSTLNAGFNDDKKKRYIDRFERETLLVSRLQHPNIVRLLDKGQTKENQLYAVFEYVEGSTLKEILKESGAFAPIDALEIMAQVLDALTHAHKRGVIHRDLKPANIILSRAGERIHVKILDFGIGSLTQEARQLEYRTITLTEETLGTPSYSAPEQLRGEPPTTKTDLYAWGLVFIECLTGQPAMAGGSLASIFHKQLSTANVPLPPAVAGHPIAKLLRRVLNKKSSGRVSSAASVYHELCQINISSLVGNLNHVSTDNKREASDYSQTAMEETVTSNTANSNIIECKQITVLAICLNMRIVTGCTIDHEVIDTLSRDQRNQCQDTAIQYGALHVGTLGDTSLFYFGYPIVTDNDTRLCARTALDIVNNINNKKDLLKINQGIEVDIRIGMHTGRVTCYPNTYPEGDTPNIAIKLSRIAKNNQILCSENSQKMLYNHIKFDYKRNSTLGAECVSKALFSLNGERKSEVFGFLREISKNSSFYGRSQEMVQLEKTLNSTEHPTSKARIAYIQGEAGIGKSRLILELINTTKRMQHFVTQCLPEHKNNALYPILNLLKYRYHIDTLTDLEAFQRLRFAINQLEGSDTANEKDYKKHSLAIICSWLSIPMTNEMVASNLPPNEQRKLLFKTITGLLICANTTQSIPTNSSIEDENTRNLYIFEDAHWADPTSIEFIAEFIQHSGFITNGDALIITSRQSPTNSLNNLCFDQITLNKLSNKSTSKFIEDLFDNDHIEKNALRTLISRTDGIPLFIEELVTMLKKNGLVHKLNGIINFTNPDKLDDIPNSLRDSLHQKLDTLIDAKETSQLAATIGRQFDYTLLVSASNRSESQVQNDLNELTSTDLIYKQRRVGGDHYIFKHALLRDAAYESISKKVAQESHLRIAGSILKLFPEQAANTPEIVAQHYAHARIFSTASIQGISAIEQKVRNSANIEALNFGEKVLKWISDITITRQKYELELKAHAAMLPAILTVYGYGGSEVIDLSQRIKKLTKYLNEIDSKKNDATIRKINEKSDWVLFLSLHYTSQRAAARELGERMLTCARKDNDRQKTMVVLVHLAQAHMFDGDIELSISEYEEALDLYDENIDKDVATEYGTDAKAQNLALSSLSYLHLGQVSTATKKVLEAIEYSETINHETSKSFAYIFRALLAHFINDDKLTKQTINLYSNKHGGKKDQVWHNIFLDLLYSSSTDNPKEAEKLLQTMLDSGQNFAAGWYAPPIAQAYIKQGQPVKAMELMESTLEKCKELKIMATLPFLKHELALCYYEIDQCFSPRIRRHLDESIHDAKTQKSKYFEIKALTSYCQITKPNAERISRLRFLIKGIPRNDRLSAYKSSEEILDSFI